jgi:hypothetical protein
VLLRCATSLGLLSLYAFGCSEAHERPPFASDQVLSDAGRAQGGKGSDLIVTQPTSEGDGCGQTVELPVQRPNFYFVLDYSGSMNEVMPESGGQTRLAAAREAVNLMLRDVGSQVNFGMALFPDPSSGDECAPGQEVFATRTGDGATSSGEDGPALTSFMSALRRHGAGGGTPVAPTLAQLRDSIAALPGQTYVFLVTDGAPNCNLEVPCGADLCIPNIEGAMFEDGTRCDAQLNCCAPDILPAMCLDEPGSVAELEALAEAGVPAFIVGMPGSETYANTLDRMAEAAGTPRSDGPHAYYSVNDTTELATTLARLGRSVFADCALQLSVSAARREQVQVLADDLELELDTDWEWSTDSTVILLGETCERWKVGDFAQIHLQENCRPEVL